MDPSDHRADRRAAAPARSPPDPRRRASATTGPSSSSSGSAPPPTLATAEMISASGPICSRSRSARSRSTCVAGVEHRQHRDLRARARRVAVQPQRRLERRERKLVDPHRPRERMRRAPPRPRRRDRRSAPPAVLRAACRPSSRRAPRPPRQTARSMAPRRAPGSRRRRPARRSRRRRSQGPRARRASSIGTSSTNPRARKFDWWTRRIAPTSASAPLSARSIVAEPSPVGRADLDHPCAGLGDHLGDPEAAADLDQLPAGDDDRSPGTRERRCRQQHGGGAVVDDDRRLGSGQLAQQRLDVACQQPRSPLSRSSSRLE